MAADGYDIAEIMGGLYGPGVIGLQQAFPRDMIEVTRREVMALYAEAREASGGALPRGPERWYVETSPERLSGFADIAMHPWVVAVSEAVLGPDYRIVELGFDIPFPGAEDQPWHRDFAAPDATTKGRRLNSLAFNLPLVDTIPEMGPFEIAPGTQWDVVRGCPRGMFPPRDTWGRYAARGVKKLPLAGDISARSALTIHRGTANRSPFARPVLVVGVDAPDAGNAAHHDLQVTRGYQEALPARVRKHLHARVVDRLEPVVQAHVIEGLVAGVY